MDIYTSSMHHDKNQPTLVFVIDKINHTKITSWIDEVSSRSGELLECQYDKSRTLIYGFNNLDLIRKTIKAMLPELNKLFISSISAFFSGEMGPYEEADVDYWDTQYFQPPSP